MSLMDKAKFWKKDEENIDDLSGLGDFGLEEGHGHDAGHGVPGDGMDEPPSLDEPPKPGMVPGVPTQMEDLQPTQASMDLGNQFGLRQTQQNPQMQAQHSAPSHGTFPPPQEPGMSSLSKDMEIIHAKLDAIRSSLDSINQRLATLERIASGEGKNRYSW